jgi:hypothetical protein
VTLVTLMEDRDLAYNGTPHLLAAARASGLRTAHHPIRDKWVPGAHGAVVHALQQLHAWVAGGGSLVVHCNGGQGRTGLVVCLLLCTAPLGALAPSEAVAAVRRARPGTCLFAPPPPTHTLRKVWVGGYLCVQRSLVGLALGLPLSHIATLPWRAPSKVPTTAQRQPHVRTPPYFSHIHARHYPEPLAAALPAQLPSGVAPKGPGRQWGRGPRTLVTPSPLLPSPPYRTSTHARTAAVPPAQVVLCTP